MKSIKRDLIILGITTAVLFALSEVSGDVVNWYFFQLSPTPEPIFGYEPASADSAVSLSTNVSFYSYPVRWLTPLILAGFFVARFVWRSPHRTGYMRSMAFPATYALISLVLHTLVELTRLQPFFLVTEWILEWMFFALFGVVFCMFVAGVTLLWHKMTERDSNRTTQKKYPKL